MQYMFQSKATIFQSLLYANFYWPEGKRVQMVQTIHKMWYDVITHQI